MLIVTFDPQWYCALLFAKCNFSKLVSHSQNTFKLYLNMSIACGWKTTGPITHVQNHCVFPYLFCTTSIMCQTDCNRRPEWLPCLLSDLSCVSFNVIGAICLAPVATVYHDVCSPGLRKPINSKRLGKETCDNDIILPVLQTVRVEQCGCLYCTESGNEQHNHTFNREIHWNLCKGCTKKNFTLSFTI